MGLWNSHHLGEDLNMRNNLNIKELIMTSIEIKLEIFRLANQILTNRIVEKRNTIFQEYSMKNQTDPNTKNPELPEMPTIENVIVEAEKINKYINQP